MDNELQGTIEHLRGLIRELQSSLETRTILLKNLLPHVEEASHQDGNYIWFELVERNAELISRFKEEYEKEKTSIQHKNSKP